MYKKIFPMIIFLLLVCCLPAAADDSSFVIGMNGSVKKAAETASGNQGVTVSLNPNEDTSLWRVYAVELAVFAEDSGVYKQYKPIQVIKSKNGSIGLNITVDFGAASDYEYGKKYKLACRYTYQNVADETVFTVPGQDKKEGWRLIGESNPCVPSDMGFYFILVNNDFAMEITSLKFYRSGFGYITADKTALSGPSLWLGLAAANDCTISYTAENPIALASYQVQNHSGTNVTSGSIGASGSGKMAAFSYDTSGEVLTLTLTLTDIYGNTKSDSLSFNFDSKNPIATESPNYDLSIPINDKTFYERWKFSEEDGIPISADDVITNYKGSRFSGKVITTDAKGIKSTFKNVSSFLSGGVLVMDYTVPDEACSAIAEDIYIYDRAGNYLTLSGTVHTYDNTPPSGKISDYSNAPKHWTNADDFGVETEFTDNAGMNNVVGISPSGTKITSSTEYIVSGAIRNTFFFTETDTGKLTYSFEGSDISRPTDKAANAQDFDGQPLKGYTYFELWIDRTNPKIVIGVHEGEEIQVPFNLAISALDTESAYGKGDSSGVKKLEYCLTNDGSADSWVSIGTSGGNAELTDTDKRYLSVRATDYAGNVTTENMVLSLTVPNEEASIDSFSIIDRYRYTIANETVNEGLPVYVVSPSAYSAKYCIDINDADPSDKYMLTVQLINIDNPALKSKTMKHSFDGKGRNEFSVSYTSSGGKLPDGLYEVRGWLTEIKPGGQSISTIENLKFGEIAIKRSPCAEWEYSASDGSVRWKLDHSHLNGGLNRNYLLALEKDKYKITGESYQDAVLLPSGYFGVDISQSTTLTLLHTDFAGNESVLSKYAEKSDNTTGSLGTAGADATESRSRVATTYYIGTRRAKTAGVDNSKLTFAR